MKYAFVNNVKIKATKGAKGICPNCGSEVIAHCGNIKVHHWKHKQKRDCDSWWEKETEWHREWKNRFPEEWQEISFPDNETGDMHRADVSTEHGLVIEFQHSRIDPTERNSREKFYNNMVWVVDATRLKGDYPRLKKGIHGFLRTKRNGFFLLNNPKDCFPSAWLESLVPVIFDFRGIQKIDHPHDIRNYLYCLYPNPKKEVSVVSIFLSEAFIKNAINGQWFKEEPKPQQQKVKPPIQNKIIKRRREPTHYYDPKKGRFVKKQRF